MKSSLIKLFPWCLSLAFLCWGGWSNVEWNKTSLILFYVEQTNDRMFHKVDSLQRIISESQANLNIFNHDGILEESKPNRVVSDSNSWIIIEGNGNSVKH